MDDYAERLNTIAGHLDFAMRVLDDPDTWEHLRGQFEQRPNEDARTIVASYVIEEAIDYIDAARELAHGDGAS